MDWKKRAVTCLLIVTTTQSAQAGIEARSYINESCPISGPGNTDRLLGSLFGAIVIPAIATRLVSGVGKAIEKASKEKVYTKKHRRYFDSYEYNPAKRSLQFSSNFRCITTIVGEFSTPDDREGTLKPKPERIETSEMNPHWNLSGLQKLGFPLKEAPLAVAEFRIVASKDNTAFQLKKEFFQYSRPFSTKSKERGFAITYEIVAPGTTEDNSVLASIPISLGRIEAKAKEPIHKDFSNASYNDLHSGQVLLPGLTPAAFRAYLRLRTRARNPISLGPVALKTTVIETQEANNVGLFVAGLLTDIADDVGTAVKSELDPSIIATNEQTEFTAEKTAVVALQTAKVELAKAQLACSEIDCKSTPVTAAKQVALAGLAAAESAVQYAKDTLDRLGYSETIDTSPSVVNRSRSLRRAPTPARNRNVVAPTRSRTIANYQPPVPRLDSDARFRENLCHMLGKDCNTTDVNPEIYLGTTSPADQFVNTVGLRLEGKNSNGITEENVCSGSLIAKRLILTARHCMEPGVDIIWEITQAVFGLNMDPKKDPKQVVIDVKDCADFGETTYKKCKQELGVQDRDILIVRLAENAPVPPMSIAPASLINSAKALTAIGFGLTEELGPDNQRKLGERRYVEVPVVSAACNGNMDGQSDEQVYGCVPDKEMVAGRGSYHWQAAADTCGGDSGGTMYVTVSKGGNPPVWPDNYHLAGVTSRAIPIPQAGYPWCGDGGVYGRVDEPVTEWLNQLAEKEGDTIIIGGP